MLIPSTQVVNAVDLLSLVYRYTVAGVDKASIDTGVDAPDAGSNDWTNGDLLEVYIQARTDEAAFVSQLDVTVNNDTGTKYNRSLMATSGGGSPSQAATDAGNFWPLSATAASAAAGSVAALFLTFPNYMSTTFWKTGTVVYGNAQDATLSHYQAAEGVLSFRDTANPISRIKLVPDTGGVKLKVGSQLLVYKRKSS